MNTVQEKGPTLNLLEKPFTFDRVVRIAITLLVVWGVIRALTLLADVLIPFAIAMILAYLIHPFIAWLQNRFGLSRRTATLAGLMGLGTIGTAALIAAVPVILSELNHIKSLVQQVVETATTQNNSFFDLPALVRSYLVQLSATEFFQRLLTLENAKAILEHTLPGVWWVFSGTFSVILGLFGLVFIGLYLVFILLDYEAITDGWRRLIPPTYRNRVIRLVDDFTEAMSRYFRAQALISLLVGLLHVLGFWLIGLPLAVVLGLIIGLLNMVPYLQIVGVIPAVVLAILSGMETGSNVWVALLHLGIVLGIAQLIQDTILTPRIMGKVTGFNPVVILLSVSIWGKLLGILGLIIALPMTFLLYSYYREFLTSMDEATESGDDPLT